jgi:nucleotide-binding universal stress UspA family protein
MAVNMASLADDGPARVTVLRVIREGARDAELIRGQQDMAHSVEGIPYEFNLKVVEGNNVVEAILKAAEGYDLIVIGASNEPMFRSMLVGNIPEQVALQAKVTTIMVKRRHGPIKSLLRETILEPASRDRGSTT